MVNVKRVVLANCYLSHFIVSDVYGFLIRRQNRPDILSAGEEVLPMAKQTNVYSYFAS